MAKSVAACNWQELAGFIEHGGEGPLKEMCRFARATASAPGQRNLLKLAQSEPGIPISVTDLNRDPFALQLPQRHSGLADRQVRTHRREDLITQLCPTPYDPAAECPTFLRFLRQIMADNADLIGFLQRCAGHVIDGGDSGPRFVCALWNGTEREVYAFQRRARYARPGLLP